MALCPFRVRLINSTNTNRKSGNRSILVHPGCRVCAGERSGTGRKLFSRNQCANPNKWIRLCLSVRVSVNNKYEFRMLAVSSLCCVEMRRNGFALRFNIFPTYLRFNAFSRAAVEAYLFRAHTILIYVRVILPFRIHSFSHAFRQKRLQNRLIYPWKVECESVPNDECAHQAKPGEVGWADCVCFCSRAFYSTHSAFRHFKIARVLAQSEAVRSSAHASNTNIEFGMQCGVCVCAWCGTHIYSFTIIK